jgi:hypothetical protein
MGAGSRGPALINRNLFDNRSAKSLADCVHSASLVWRREILHTAQTRASLGAVFLSASKKAKKHLKKAIAQEPNLHRRISLQAQMATFVMSVLVATAPMIFIGGFASGYGMRALVSRHHREIARRHRVI